LPPSTADEAKQSESPRSDSQQLIKPEAMESEAEAEGPPPEDSLNVELTGNWDSPLMIGFGGHTRL
jgi:hypothetical protein